MAAGCRVAGKLAVSERTLNMRHPWTYIAILCGVTCALPLHTHAQDSFSIQSVQCIDQIPRVKANPNRGASGQKFLEVRVRTSGRVKPESVYARAYFYTSSGKLVEKIDRPDPVPRVAGKQSAMPDTFVKNKSESLYFEVPEAVLKEKDWQSVVVFGNTRTATATAYPRGILEPLDFPERSLAGYPTRPQKAVEAAVVQGEAPAIESAATQREAPIAIGSVIEHVVKTDNPKQPQITLFLCPPAGMADFSKANGLLALCLLAKDVAEIKRRLQQPEARDEVGNLLRFAEKHRLAILCWGSKSLWDPNTSWDEQSKRLNRHMDETFDDVAKAWAKGVDDLARKYGTPRNGFLLWGISGSAQYACRLALRKPEYFLAIHVHVPSSFDRPTPEAGRILWCLTTGENETGYERSLRFYSACRELGYPIIYKAIIGLGHQGNPLADKLGMEFFEYALTERATMEKSKNGKGRTLANARQESARGFNRGWPPDSFRTPKFVGDVVNQQIFPLEKADMVPVSFRTPLPTLSLAETWNLEK